MLSWQCRRRLCVGLAMRFGRLQQREYLLLDRQFVGIGQFESIAGKNFDPIVGPWIVRGGNHHAGIKLPRARQVSHTRRRDYAGAVRSEERRVGKEWR